MSSGEVMNIHNICLGIAILFGVVLPALLAIFAVISCLGGDWVIDEEQERRDEQ